MPLHTPIVQPLWGTLGVTAADRSGFTWQGPQTTCSLRLLLPAFPHPELGTPCRRGAPSQDVAEPQGQAWGVRAPLQS